MIHLLVIGVLVCIMCGLVHVYASLNRIQASLYEMTENEELRRKAFRLRRTADWLDYPLKYFRRKKDGS